MEVDGIEARSQSMHISWFGLATSMQAVVQDLCGLKSKWLVQDGHAFFGRASLEMEHATPSHISKKRQGGLQALSAVMISCVRCINRRPCHLLLTPARSC